MRFNIKRCLIILLACIFIPLSVLSSGNSTWHILQQKESIASNGNIVGGDTFDKNTVNGNMSVAGNQTSNEMHTVSYYHWLTSSETVTSTVSGGSANTPASRSGNFITGYTYSVSSTSATFTVTSPNGLFNGVSYNFNSLAKGTTATTETRSNTDGTLTEKLIFSAEFSSSWGTHTYTVSWSFEVKTVTLTEQFDSTVDTQQVMDGFYAEKPDFSNHSLVSSGYSLIGFYEHTTTGPGSEYDFTESPITDNKKIIAQWSSKSETSGASGNSLTSRVASLTSGNELKVYLGATASGTYDYTTDYTYAATGKALNLGYASTPTTIASGATLSLSMDGMSGAYHQEAGFNKDTKKPEAVDDVAKSQTASSTDYFVSLDYTGKTTASATCNPRDYTVRLQNDLIINGTLNIGGYTGSPSSSTLSSPQGMIIGNYVKLDLNGHTITVAENGTLQSFGYITDSVGTGKIIVEPKGTLLTQIVITSLKGGNSTVWSYSKGLCPFEDYCFPYIDTNVEVLSTTDGAGALIGVTKLNFGGLGFINLYMPLIGNASSNSIYVQKNSAYLFTISGEGKVTLSHNEISALKTGVFLHQNYYLKNNFTFDHVTVAFTAPRFFMDLSVLGISIENAVLDLQRIVFPLSSFLDVTFVNSSTFILNQKIQVLGGSTITIDESSTLVFDYYKSGGVAAKKDFPTIEKIVKLHGEDKYLSGGILAVGDEFFSTLQYYSSLYGLYSASYNEYFKNTFSNGTVNIYGNIKFTSGNSSEAPYTLAGNINATTFSVDNGSKQTFNLTNLQSIPSTVNMRTYDLNIHSGVCYWLPDDYSQALKVLDNSVAHTNVAHFYALPMTNNGTSYLFNSDSDKSIAKTGKYQEKTGIFTATDDSTYFFLTDNSLLTTTSAENTSKGSNTQDYSIDYTITPTVCTVGENLTITYNGQSYAYFGGLYFPITATTSTTQVTANLQKFSSNSAFVAEKTLTYQNGYWKIS